MNEIIKEHLMKVLGDQYTLEIQLQIEESIIDSNIASIDRKIVEVTGKSIYKIWKEQASPEEIEAKRLYMRQYYLDRKEEWGKRYRKTIKKYQAKNKEKLQAYRAEYYKEYLKTYTRVSPLTPEQIEKQREYRRKYYQRNKERFAQKYQEQKLKKNDSEN